MTTAIVFLQISQTLNPHRYPLDIFASKNGDMKELLRKGTAADLNVYVTMLNNGGIIGCVSAHHIVWRQSVVNRCASAITMMWQMHVCGGCMRSTA